MFFTYSRSSSLLADQTWCFFFELFSQLLSSTPRSFIEPACFIWHGTLKLHLRETERLKKKRIKVTQPKPADHWRQQCEKWQKSIRHFNLSPLKDVGKKGWLRRSGSLDMEEQPDNWRETSSASNSIISDGPRCRRRVVKESWRWRRETHLARCFQIMRGAREMK